MEPDTSRGDQVINYKNIYHMLAYAFQVLNEGGYKKVLTESFENTAELLAAILCKGVSKQIKRGLVKDYIQKEESLASPRGKILVSESIKTQSIRKKQLVCSYDDFTVNAYNNRIIKTTFDILLKSDISKSRKKDIKRLLVYFGDVEILDKHNINWNQKFNRNNQTYQMLISVCYLVIKGLLQTQSDGTTKLMEFFDEQRMCRLYEKFILEYYRKHYSPQIKASSSQIGWALDDGYSVMLPTMQSDIMLSKGDKTLIIDAKYYAHNTQVQYDVHTIHSNNLYQIFTYVKNKATEGGEVAGILLYAKTDAVAQPDNTYMMSGNKISVTTLDLEGEFTDISGKLDMIVKEYFGLDKN